MSILSSNNKTLLKVLSMTSLAVLIKMTTVFVSTKVVAYIVGASGIAILGQLNNFVTIMLQISSGGINNGITKYVSEYKDKLFNLSCYVGTASRFVIVCSFLCCILLLLLCRPISTIIFFSASYNYVIIIFGLTIAFYSFNNYLISVVNGLQQYRLYTAINISNSIIGLLFTVVLVYFWNLKGALIAVVSYQSVVLLITTYLIKKEKWFSVKYLLGRYSGSCLKKYIKYSVSAVIFIISTPFIQMFLRANVIHNLSEYDAGIWEAMNRISAMYMTIINTTLSIYYIPRLSELNSINHLRNEIYNAYKLLLPLVIIGFAVIYILRREIVVIALSKEFLPVVDLFLWQLILDFINTISFVISYLIIAKAMIKMYTILTLIFSGLYMTISWYLLSITHNVVGIIQGNIISQVLYLLILIIIFRKILLPIGPFKR